MTPRSDPNLPAGACPGLAASNPGLQKMILGAFGLPFGLFMTILSGAELFTGNTALVTMAYLNDKVSKEQLAKSWGYSYAGNFVGSVALAALVVAGGTLSASAAPAAIAAAKTSMAFKTALIRGVLCNWLVCMAVYLASHARDVGGKMVAIWFPISAFVAMGLEHSVANMFLVPLAIMQVRPSDCALISATSRRYSAPSAHAAPACTPRSAASAGRGCHVGHLPHEESPPRHAWQHHRRRRCRRARLHPCVQGVIKGVIRRRSCAPRMIQRSSISTREAYLWPQPPQKRLRAAAGRADRRLPARRAGSGTKHAIQAAARRLQVQVTPLILHFTVL